jgi:Protein of unknown function (DUF3455)
MNQYLASLAVAVTIALPQTAFHDRVMPPHVPDNIEVPAGNKPFLMLHAVGTQGYMCVPSGASFAWEFFGPQATLFDDDVRQVTTHFLSPNPLESGFLRAAWQHSRDTSAVWAQAIESSTDPAFVRPGAIPWLLLRVVGEQEGPTGGDTLTATTFIQRVNTQAGTAPSTGCAISADVKKRALVMYEADYVFYRGSRRHGHDQ